MNNVNNSLLKLYLLILVSFNFIYSMQEKKESEEIKPQIIIHNVAILLDTKEKSQKEFDTITGTFHNLLISQKIPIIVSEHTIKTFEETYKLNQMQNKKKPSKIFHEIKNLYAKFDIYNTAYKKSLYLLIPKNYINNIYKNFDTKVIKKKSELYLQDSYEELISGFKISPKSKMLEKISFENMQKQVKELDKRFLDKTITSFEIESVFTQGKDDIYGIWNIYLIGHGSYYKEIESDQLTSKNIKIVYQENLNNIDIAGINIIEFQKFIQFLNYKINTNFLNYTSCYAGGLNIVLAYINILVNKQGNIIGKIQKPNFTVVSNASTDELTWLYTTKINFTSFFDLLNNFTRKNTTSPTKFNDSQLRNILNSIVISQTLIESIASTPLVLHPQSEKFQPLSLKQTIGIITDVLAKQSIIEHKAIEMANKEAILIDTNNVEALTIDKKSNIPSIVSLIPGIGLNTISSLITDMTFKEFIDSFTQIRPAFEKFFFINNLSLINDKYGPSVKQETKIRNLPSILEKIKLTQKPILSKIIENKEEKEFEEEQNSNKHKEIEPIISGEPIYLNSVFMKLKLNTLFIIFTDQYGTIYYNSYKNKKFKYEPSLNSSAIIKESNLIENNFINKIYDYFIRPNKEILELELHLSLEPSTKRNIVEYQSFLKEFDYNIFEKLLSAEEKQILAIIQKTEKSLLTAPLAQQENEKINQLFEQKRTKEIFKELPDINL